MFKYLMIPIVAPFKGLVHKVDKGALFEDLNNTIIQDNAYEAIRRFMR
jgi:hypothetical protein